MSQPPPPSQPNLTPQFCFNQTALRDFLRLSRATVDDSITQSLNAMLTPSHPSFDPTSTSSRQTSTKMLLSPHTCSTFRNSILFPTWQSRSDILTYCASVATSPDPDDPDLISRQTESLRERERVIDERLDPYSARFFPQEARTEELARTVRNERVVEGIVRQRTWGVVEERCGDQGVGWEESMEMWRAETGRGSGRR